MKPTFAAPTGLGSPLISGRAEEKARGGYGCAAKCRGSDTWYLSFPHGCWVVAQSQFVRGKRRRRGMFSGRRGRGVKGRHLVSRA